MKSILREPYRRFFGTLANQYRLDIIETLQEGDKTVGQIAKKLKCHQTTVSHNLRRLVECGFVKVTKKGKEKVCRLNKETIKPLLSLMHKHMNAYCKHLNHKYSGGNHE